MRKATLSCSTGKTATAPSMGPAKGLAGGLRVGVSGGATAAAGAEIAISDESLDLRWWSIDDLPEGTDAGLSRLVDAARGLRHASLE
jgi:hypothetical protein